MTFRTFRTIIGLVMEGDSAAGLNSWKLRLVVADLRFVLVRDDLKYHGGDDLSWWGYHISPDHAELCDSAINANPKTNFGVR